MQADTRKKLATTMTLPCPTTEPGDGPLLIFVLGAPCAGKSTLCTALAARYTLDHFSIGNEMRSLVSVNPTGPAAHIKSKFSALELEIFAKSVRAGALAPAHQTPKYVKERIFPEGIETRGLRVLIDGFPRQVDRWAIFKGSVENVWKPDQRTVAINLEVDRQVALSRFVGRGRDGDVFERRFDDYTETIGDIVRAMEEDGMTIIDVLSEEGVEAETTVRKLENSEAWIKAISTRVFPAGEEKK